MRRASAIAAPRGVANPAHFPKFSAYRLFTLGDLMKRVDPHFLGQLLAAVGQGQALWFFDYICDCFSKVETDNAAVRGLALEMSTGLKQVISQVFAGDTGPLISKDELAKLADNYEANGLPMCALLLRDEIANEALDLAACLQELRREIQREVRLLVLMRIPTDKARYYQHSPSELFGSETVAAFRSTERDIEEAAKCYAAGRNTACVMHVQKILERGLRELGRALDVSNVEHLPSWDAILLKIDRELQKRHNEKPEGWAVDEPFYAEAAAFLREVQKAWRNPSTHIGNPYDEEKALEVFDSVKKFMRHLATRLKEKTPE
jgi:hypothetical protein